MTCSEPYEEALSQEALPWDRVRGRHSTLRAILGNNRELRWSEMGGPFEVSLVPLCRLQALSRGPETESSS